MKVLEKETISKIGLILNDKYYKEWTDYLEKVFKETRSRQNRSNSMVLLGIQFGLAKIETEIWKMIKIGRSHAKKLNQIKLERILTDQETKDLAGYEKQIFINEQIIRISRTICDGIAWRNLKYNRFFLSSAARGCGAGDIDIDKKSFKAEFKWACRISKELNSIVIMNDLTHFLRVGDLTEISKDGVFIHELKKFGREIKNIFTLQKMKDADKTSNQMKRLVELQNIALLGKVNVGSSYVGAEKIAIKLKTNFQKINTLLIMSEKDPVISQKIEPCITVHITNFRTMRMLGDDSDLEKMKSKLQYPSSGTMFITSSNLDSFYSDVKGNFLRGQIPFSVYPLSSKYCMDLMSGRCMVNIILNIDELKKILESHNWLVEMITDKELDHQIQEYESREHDMFSNKYSLYEALPSELGLLRIKRGPFSLNLTTSIYSRIMLECMTLKSFLEMLEDMYRIAAKREKSHEFFPVFPNEEKIWN